MKRLTLFVGALALSFAAFATVPQARTFRSSQLPRIKVVQEELESTIAPKKQKLADEKDSVLIPYTLTPDFKNIATTYQVGKPSDGLLYSNYQQGLIAPYMPGVYFVSDSMRPATWLVDGEVAAENVPYFPMPLKFGEENPMPLMRTPGNADTLFLDYQIAGLTVKSWHEDEGVLDFFSAINVAPAEFLPLTNCAMYTEDPREDEDGQDYYKVGGSSLGSYSYGTKLANPWDGGTFDTIFVPFNNDGLMVISDITLAIYTNGATSAAMFPGDDDHVRVTLYPTVSTAQTWYDYVDWANPIATAVADLDNFTPYVAPGMYPDYPDGISNIGLLQFNFLQEDPITGALTPGTVDVEGDFIVALTEYNDGTANFGIFADYFATGGNKTWLVGHDAEGSYATGLWSRKHNILLNVDAYMPAFIAPEKVAFAEGETEKVLDIPSNVWDEDIELDEDETSEWITVEIATDYETKESEGEEYYIHNFVNKLTITLDESEEVREGKIVLSAYGLPVTIKVSQNDATTGVQNVNFKNDGKLYNVLGIEVGEDYKGVVIRNGEKFVK